MTTYSDKVGPTDCGADTEVRVGGAAITIPSGKGGRIKEIHIAKANVVNAKASSGVLELKLGSHSGPFKFAIGGGEGAATIGTHKDAEVIHVDIEVFANETVDCYVTCAEANVDCVVSILWVAG